MILSNTSTSMCLECHELDLLTWDTASNMETEV